MAQETEVKKDTATGLVTTLGVGSRGQLTFYVKGVRFQLFPGLGDKDIMATPESMNLRVSPKYSTMLALLTLAVLKNVEVRVAYQDAEESHRPISVELNDK